MSTKTVTTETYAGSLKDMPVKVEVTKTAECGIIVSGKMSGPVTDYSELAPAPAEGEGGEE